MKNKKILNILILVTIAILLFAMPTKVLGASNLDDIFGDDQLEDQTGDINKDEPTTTPEPTPQQPTTPTTPTTPENTYSDAGLVEDTIMIIAIAVLGITAVYAYRKVNQYQGI